MRNDILATKAFLQKLDKYPDQDSVKKAVRILVVNPAHPSLNVHRYKGVKKGIWECYINDGDRILFEVTKNALHLWYLGHHSMLDRARQFNFTANKTFAQFVISPQPTDISELETVAVPSKEYDNITFSREIPESEDEIVISESELVEAPTARELFTESVDKEDTNQNCFSNFEDSHLRILGVPSELVQGVKDALSMDEVFVLPGLPQDVNKRLLDAYTSPDLTVSMFDKSLLVYRTTLDNFEGYCGGKIRQLMLNLLPDQQEYVEMEGEPLVLVNGAAGSGKTAIGIYRAIRLAKLGRRVLVITFNRTLSNTIEILAKRLVGSSLPTSLEIMTLHSKMKHLLGEINIINEKAGLYLLKSAIDEVKKNEKASALLKREAKFFQEEIRYVIKGLGIDNIDEYIILDRGGFGRKVGLRRDGERQIVWKIYEAYQRNLQGEECLDWADLAIHVLKLLPQNLLDSYDDIIVDEAQDFTHVDMSVILRLVKANVNKIGSSSITLLADPAQTLYSRKLPWKQSTLDTKIRSEKLRKNHRSTQQITEAAAHLLKQNTLMKEEYIDPESVRRQGVLPILVEMSTIPLQIQWVGERIIDLMRDKSFQPSDFAVLCPNNRWCDESETILKRQGLNVTLRDTADYNAIHFDLLEEKIKILTIHSAKGLEFPVVFMIGLNDRTLPTIAIDSRIGEDKERIEELEKSRRLCYVGMTRAADGLYLMTGKQKSTQSLFVHELEDKVIVW